MRIIRLTCLPRHKKDSVPLFVRAMRLKFAAAFYPVMVQYRRGSSMRLLPKRAASNPSAAIAKYLSRS